MHMINLFYWTEKKERKKNMIFIKRAFVYETPVSDVCCFFFFVVGIIFISWVYFPSVSAGDMAVDGK